jgi:hypothetical protein
MKANSQSGSVKRVFRAVMRLVAALATACGLLWFFGMVLLHVANHNRGLLAKFSPYNAVMRHLAGATPLSPFAVLTHVGRRSGREHQTPLGAFRWGDGFVLGLAYGREVDWCRNVLAAGKCTLKYKGQEYALERPEIIPISQCWDAFDLPSKVNCRAAGIRECLWVHKPQAVAAPGSADGRATVLTL